MNQGLTYPLVSRDWRYQGSVLLHWTRPTLLGLQRQLFREKTYLTHHGVH